ncbi:Molybdenum cofactor sulfurase [Apostasia shenzhenica]|uniref:Molybdenum cofactor sulfurase n=1 Tax=Apostasia shenzhenica TaxID=1088818 RepID=A0A2I0ANL4_9ASPA|nr:Molybdenum cofactor sulfurase [Apostasia shenzhenica]
MHITKMSAVRASQAANCRSMEGTKEEFLRQFGNDYDYRDAPKNIDNIRSTEFKRLEGIVYLDHAGATLYSEAQMEAVFRDLSTRILGNPHSQSDSSKATTDIINEARRQVLSYFNASPKDYKCVFTSGATGALKLVGETFPWTKESCYMYTVENHNSVIGIREYALDHGAAALAVDIEDVDFFRGMKPSIQIKKRSLQRREKAVASREVPNCEGNNHNLFAFPSECNFSGIKFPLELVNIVKEYSGKGIGDSFNDRGSWLVLIDAAKGCATEPPDLSRYPADFVVCSFYKAHPSSMGATITFNLKRSNGSWFGYKEVEQLASLSSIQLRTGCFCNPGACAKFLELTHMDILSNLEGFFHNKVKLVQKLRSVCGKGIYLLW